MAIINLHLSLEQKYKYVIADLFKYSIILIILHYLLSTSKITLKNILQKSFMNKYFIELYSYFFISILSYHLVVNELILIT
jgi:hypothetical protein